MLLLLLSPHVLFLLRRRYHSGCLSLLLGGEAVAAADGCPRRNTQGSPGAEAAAATAFGLSPEDRAYVASQSRKAASRERAEAGKVEARAEVRAAGILQAREQGRQAGAALHNRAADVAAMRVEMDGLREEICSLRAEMLKMQSAKVRLACQFLPSLSLLRPWSLVP